MQITGTQRQFANILKPKIWVNIISNAIHYLFIIHIKQFMYLTNLGNVYSLICSFSFCVKIRMASSLKKDQITDIDMLIMVEKDISNGICQDIHQYSKANNKYMRRA